MSAGSLAADSVGIGLRSAHHAELLRRAEAGDTPVNWLEVLLDNHIGLGGRRAWEIDSLSQHFVLTGHSVGLGMGSVDPLCDEYLRQLKAAQKRYGLQMVSEHCSFTRLQGEHFHDLLPMPYTRSALKHMVERIQQVQDFLGETILLENVSTYVDTSVEMNAATFFAGVVRASGCRVLLDINNLYVSETNLGESALAFIEALPSSAIAEIHLAGPEWQGDILVDTHTSPVPEPVWQLYEKVLASIGPRPTLIEWDAQLPALDVLLDEAAKARGIMANLFPDGTQEAQRMVAP